MEPVARLVQNRKDQDAVARLQRAAEKDRKATHADSLPSLSDEDSTVYAVFVEQRAVASLRLTPLDKLPDDSPWLALYDSPGFPAARATQAVLSHVRIHPEHGTGEAMLALMTAAFDGFRSAGGELAFFSCPAHLVGACEVLGWRRYAPGQDLGAGFRLPLVMIAGDWAHLEKVKSPLLDVTRRHAPNFALPDWFDRRYPEYSRPSSVRAQPLDEFMAGLVARWKGNGLTLLDDLDGGEREALMASAQTLVLDAGRVLLRKGGTDRELYLVLDGALEVSDTHRSGRQVLTTIGTGQIFGEGGFLVHTPRSADLTTVATTQLLVFSPDDFEQLSQTQPRVAMKLLRNLCRTLCLRLYAGTAN